MLFKGHQVVWMRRDSKTGGWGRGNQHDLGLCGLTSDHWDFYSFKSFSHFLFYILVLYAATELLLHMYSILYSTVHATEWHRFRSANTNDLEHFTQCDNFMRIATNEYFICQDG